MREVLEELQRRKDAKENPCDSCDGKGGADGKVCADCLGQGVLLTREEYAVVLKIAGVTRADLDNDSILDQQVFE
jgi:DnaJ-class molecular chaperone